MSMLSSALRKSGLNKPGKALANVAASVLPGGSIVKTAITGATALGLFGGGGGSKPPGTFTGSGPGLDFGDVGDLVRRMVPGGATGRGRVAPAANGRCPSGFHPARDGRGCVKNRRMNPANGRAIRRAVRRLKSAEKTFRKVLQVQGKHAGKIKPKARKR